MHPNASLHCYINHQFHRPSSFFISVKRPSSISCIRPRLFLKSVIIVIISNIIITVIIISKEYFINCIRPPSSPSSTLFYPSRCHANKRTFLLLQFHRISYPLAISFILTHLYIILNISSIFPLTIRMLRPRAIGSIRSRLFLTP